MGGGQYPGEGFQGSYIQSALGSHNLVSSIKTLFLWL